MPAGITVIYNKKLRRTSTRERINYVGTGKADTAKWITGEEI
jgi:hypothetical protein